MGSSSGTPERQRVAEIASTVVGNFELDDLIIALERLKRDGIQADDGAQLEQIVLAQRERAKTAKEMAANSVFFFRAPAAYDDKAVRKHVTPDVLGLLKELVAGLGKLAQPIRLAVCGGTVSPPIDAIRAIPGKSESLARLANAMALWTA